MSPKYVVYGSFVAVLAIAATALSKTGGVLPGGTGSNTSQTRISTNSCGGCHGGAAPKGTVVTVTPTARVLQANQTVSVTVAASNAAVATGEGGFAADISAGTLIAKGNTQARADNLAIAHSDKSTRSWTFDFKAPTQTGLVEFYTVGMTSNGAKGADSGDEYAFHGFAPSNTFSTPVRFYVNAAGAVSTGAGCDDGYGNFSVLGAPLAPTVGNTNFRLEAFGLPPSAVYMLRLSRGGGVVGVDMAKFGAPGCVLWTDTEVELKGITTAGIASRSEGSVVFPAAIPNDNVFHGQVFSVQVLAVDSMPKRPLPVIVTNGLELTVP